MNDAAVTNHHRPEWPAELSGCIHWGQGLGGRHPKHAPRAMALAIEMMIVLTVQQAEAAARVQRYIDQEVARRRIALAEAWTRETLRSRYGVEQSR